MTILIPICFYPMRKIIVDDDQAFSQSILLKMSGKNFISYNSPQDALNYLLHEYKAKLNKSDLIAKNLSSVDSSTHHVIQFDIEKLKKIFFESDHQDIAVILVDYHMPGMDGIDFLKAIRHLPIRKALITGENDYKVAVEAFNAGLVDAYLRKSDTDFSAKIKHIISQLEWKYFVELSSFIADMPNFEYLKNNNFYALFNQFIHDNNIESFCLTSSEGNFITKSKQKNEQYLLIRRREQLQALSVIAEEDGGSQSTIENLKHGRVIPFFNSLEYWQLPASKWDNYLYTATDLAHSDLVWTKVNAFNHNVSFG